MGSSNHRLSRLAERLIRFFCHPNFLEEILGDLEEYQHELHELPRWKRPIYFWFQVFNFIRPWSLKELIDQHQFAYFYLFKNYLKTSLRSLKRNPITSLINVSGLAIAIGICITVYSIVAYDFRIDQFHEHKDELFVCTFTTIQNGQSVQYASSPLGITQYIKSTFPQVSSCRIEDEELVFQYKDLVNAEEFRLVDPAFLEMFSFPLTWGVSSTLRDDNAVILSHEMSRKYFGYENPVGQTAKIKLGEVYKEFVITGVAAPLPAAHALDFDFLINFSNLPEIDQNRSHSDLITATIIQSDDEELVHEIKWELSEYVNVHNQESPKWMVNEFGLLHFPELHFASRTIINDLSHDMFYEGRISLPVVALILLALACFNYINIAIVSSTGRLKEIGLRKVIGANRQSVVAQFLTEHLVITGVALFIGLALTILLFIPWFVAVSDINVHFDILDPLLWLTVIGLIVLNSLISGLYPAFYVSRFEASRIFRGFIKFGKTGIVTKLLLGVQLIMACTAINTAIVFTENKTQQLNRSWGYHPDDIIYVQLTDQEAYNVLDSIYRSFPQVLAIAGNKHQPGVSKDSTLLSINGRSIEVDILEISPAFFDMAQFEMMVGHEINASTSRNQVLINETLNKHFSQLGVGNQLMLGNESNEIIGVIRDIHLRDFYHKVKPTLIKVSDPSDYQYMALKSAPGEDARLFAHVRNTWAEQFPGQPFVGGHQQDVWGPFYGQLSLMEEYNNILAVIAVFLATMGLYGLLLYNLKARTKEFSIRKIMGASFTSLSLRIIKQYALLAGVALVIGAPLSYFLVKTNLELLFAYVHPLSILTVGYAMIILIVIVLVVILSQVIKISGNNPAEGLKLES